MPAVCSSKVAYSDSIEWGGVVSFVIGPPAGVGVGSFGYTDGSAVPPEWGAGAAVVGSA